MTEIRLSPAMRAGVLIAGVVLLLMAGGIFAQLIVLQDSNDRIHAQDAKIGDLKSEVDPMLNAVRPLIAKSRPVLRKASRLADPLTATLDDVSAAAEEAPQLARAVRTLIGASLPVVDALRITLSEANPLLPEVRALVPELRGLLPELRGLLPRADDAISATLHVESIQTRSIRMIRRQLQIQKRTLAVQLEALGHIESLDTKTGGQFPAD